MTELEDHDLLAEFARSESEEAFATLVTRHVNLVYSAAWRFTGNPHHAQEITQAVFIILSRKAGSLRRCKLLSGWLYQTARLTAASFMRREIRREHREQEAYMQSTLNEPNAAAWEQIAPLLDEAMGRLGETDRNALILRFFENKSAQQVGAALKLSEPAAHKRVTRALEKLRKFFHKRGAVLTASVIAGSLSASSVQAAPAGLAVTVAATAAKGAVVSGSTLTLLKGALKLMAWSKVQTSVGVGLALLVASVGTLAVKSKFFPSEPSYQGRRLVDYFRARHGFNGGLEEMVDLSERQGFDAIRTIDDVARFASEVPGAVGFTAHPDFENGTRHASAVVSYTRLSPTQESWVLYLFDKKEAQKNPGDAPRAAALAAAEAKVSSKIDEARELIAAGGTNGVKLVGDKVLALAVLRLGGLFGHTGEFAVGRCVGCRSVVSGGNPGSCGLDVQNKKHWNCCGSTNEGGYCDYWKLIKTQDDSR